MKSQSQIGAVRAGVLSWLESVRCKSAGWGRWQYHAGMDRPWALQASANAVQTLELLGALDDVTATQRAEAVAFYQSCQDPADGLFKDPLETEDQHQGPHSWEQVWGQRHGATVTTMRLLDAQPLYPIPAAQFVDLTKTDARQWTQSQVDWTNPWAHGESWSRAIQAFLNTLPAEQRTADHPRLAGAFEVMESEILDPATGMPSRRMVKDDPSRAMAGLFKVINAYLATGRVVPHADHAIDFTLALQHEDGEFGYRDNMCINWDALWVLRELDKQFKGGHRHAEIVAAGDRTAKRLREHYLKSDGGFAFHGSHCTRNHHSIRLCDDTLPIGDMLGTKMCLNCLIYADEWHGVVPSTEDQTKR